MNDLGPNWVERKECPCGGCSCCGEIAHVVWTGPSGFEVHGCVACDFAFRLPST